MLIKVGCEITFELPAPVAMVFLLYLHPSRSATVRKAGPLMLHPSLPVSEYIDSFGNRCGRLFAPAGRIVLSNDAVVNDDGLPDPQRTDAIQHAVQDLPHETLLYLLASRYCEVDSDLTNLAWTQFGGTPPGWPRVQAICDFVHRHLRFDYNQARATRTAAEAFRERVGVCRDFMHLAITLCRCMNIPARYCTGYLGDIGVPPAPFPMDFSAWFEAFLGGRWYSLDARHNVPRIGRILMARGRDAADVALTTIFGYNELVAFNVWTDELFEDNIRTTAQRNLQSVNATA
jgi:transglutaminase-like putative cysteine protease